MKKNLKKRSKNHVVHLSHSHAINYHVPSLLFVTPSSTCGTWYGLQVYMQGTQERLGSCSAINETKSSAALVTDCLVSRVQTGSSTVSVCMAKHVSKISCQCRQRRMKAKLFLEGLQLAYSQVLCRQNVRIQQK